ncbi:ring finger protein [Fusarium sporotrichioides]|uniref:Ring finger protein n=1 Tax=Fusarium sporotrichioides TaxID=5514 RepID=A0A395RN36_FUSSP|nr:ring finger protein [Fusarium sporotrichioides]
MVRGDLSCNICQLLPGTYSRKVFKHAHGFKDDWEPQAESDEERYRIPEICRNNILRDYLESARVTRILARPEYLQRMSRNVKRTVFRNLQRTDEYDALQARAQEQQRGRPIDDGTDFSYTTIPVKAYVNFLEGDRVTVRVCRAMFVRNGRWYLGHRPGTYIFKYRGSQTAGSDLDTSKNVPGYITMNDFEYAGQVPRHEKVHIQRLGLLFNKVLRLFISELQVFAGLQHGETYPQLEGLLRLERVESALWFTGFWGWWRDAFLNTTEWPDAEVRNCFVSHPSILELAWILNYLKRRRSGENQPPEPLELLVITATQEQLPELAERWETMEQAVAWKMLKSGRRKGLFVYEVTPETEDIHNFYSQAPFYDDPLNPAIIHSFTPLARYLLSATDYQVALSRNRNASQS